MTDKIVTVQAATISGSEPTQTPVNADVSTINVTAVVQDANVSASVDETKLDVQVSGMGEEVLPNDTLFKRNQEYSHIGDTFKARTGKLFLELVSKSDVVSLLVNYKRTFIENKTVTEVKSFAIGKKLVDTSSMQDSARKRLDKVFNDLFTYSDQNSKRVGKNVVENQLVSELVKLTTGKNVVDTATTQDVLSRQVNFFRIFVDSVDATDDFLGEANVDDDQTARIGKNVVEYTTLSDTDSKKVSPNKLETVSTAEQKSVKTTKVLLDSKILSDIVRLAYSKVTNDTTSNSEVLLVNLGKSVLEYTNTSDTPYKRVAKNYVDTLSNTDPNAKTVGKNTNDTTDAADVNYMQFVKIVNELVNSTDVVAQLIKPGKVDQAAATDVKFLALGKNLVETQITTDVYSRVVNYNRIFTDTVDATDDFLGQANIDDDQTARVGKNVIEYVGFQESKDFKTGKYLLDTLNSSEVLAKNFGKNLLDQFSKSDIVSKTAGKNIVDAADAGDLFTRIVAYNRSFTDTLAYSEVVSKESRKILTDLFSSVDLFSRLVNYNRTFADITTTADIKYFNVSKKLVDTTNATTDTVFLTPNKRAEDSFTTTDSLSRTVDYKRTYTDIVDATDDFLGEANIDDDQIARVGKVLVDYPTTSDMPTFSGGKTLADSAAAQEASYKKTTKPVNDQFSTSETVNRKPGKGLVDTVISADVFSFNKTTNLPLLDSAGANDSGLINIQSYFAGTFATPGYVGTNTSFT